MVKRKKRSQQKYLFPGLAIIIIFLLTATVVVKSNQSRSPDLPEPSLKELAAAHDIALGNFAIRNHLNERPYTDILTSQFDFALADNTPNWYFKSEGLRPSRTSYNFKQM